MRSSQYGSTANVQGVIVFVCEHVCKDGRKSNAVSGDDVVGLVKESDWEERFGT
jgi:hypothetical protein